MEALARIILTLQNGEWGPIFSSTKTPMMIQYLSSDLINKWLATQINFDGCPISCMQGITHINLLSLTSDSENVYAEIETESNERDNMTQTLTMKFVQEPEWKLDDIISGIGSYDKNGQYYDLPSLKTLLAS